MAKPSLELSILMPCLDEAETILACIAKARGFIDRSGIAAEIIIADNGSTDGSQQLARSAGARVIDVAERGYGAALAAGIENARGRYVIMADADDSYDFANLEPFIAKLRGGAQLVMGNRFAGGIKPGAMPWHHRYVGNPVLSFAGRLFFGARIGDFHCGLRGFERAAMLELNLRTTGMEFASEMIVKATLATLRIAEVPTSLSPDGRSRAPHLRSFRDGWRHLRFLLLFSPRWLFLYPGLALLATGLFLGALLMGGPIHLSEHVQVDIHTFLMASMFVIVGMQAISFAIIGRRFASQYGFIPRSQRFDAVLESLTLERVLILALFLVLCGVGTLIWGVREWAVKDFGPLDPSATLRLLIVAMTALVAGLQLMMSGFMSSMIAIPLLEKRLPKIAVPDSAAPARPQRRKDNQAA